jgi:predicted  nucleic acid-binding Zn-ribbon protein
VGWIETLNKESFQLAVREAMRPDFEKLENRMDKLENRMDKLEVRIGDLEQRVSRLEGSIEGTMRAYEANVRGMFSEFKAELFSRMLEDKSKSAA